MPAASTTSEPARQKVADQLARRLVGAPAQLEGPRLERALQHDAGQRIDLAIDLRHLGIVGRIDAHHDAGIVLQRALESRAFELGGGTYEAPGQLIGDFLAGRASTALGDVMPSYKPGVKLGDLGDSLPAYAIAAIREALPVFGRKIKGFDRHDAVFTGVETRTSSPLRITRGADFQSLNVRGLYPAGEGAGYAGGILSAGVDGIRTAEALARELAGAALEGVAAGG